MTNTPNIQNLKCLLACFGFVLASHLIHLPVWLSIACFIFGAWRLGILYKHFSAPKLSILAPLTLLIGLGVMITFSGQINKYSGLSLLFGMISLKLLETKTKRDFFIVVIALYLVVGYLFLFSQSLLSFLLSLVATILLTSTLLQLHIHRPISFASLYWQTGKMLFQATPLMLLLFVLFPRASGPLWGGIEANKPKIGMPGLSRSMELNQMSHNVKDNSVAFRVQFNGATPNNQDLYWRGPVLWTVIGDQWLAADSFTYLAQEKIWPIGKPYVYTITLEPNEHEWLLMLDMPTQAPVQGSLTRDYSVIAHTNNLERNLYTGVSYTNYRLGPINRLPRHTSNMALQVDEDANPRTLAMARGWSHLSQLAIIEHALAYYKNQQFTYSLNPTTARHDVIDQFLFESKSGFCEHFATSFVLMMRAAGIPARVVTGYQGGEKNKDYFIIRQSDAHAWAEVWLTEQGWVRIDPTATVAPERVEMGLAQAIEKSESLQSDAGEQEKTPLAMALKTRQHPALRSALLRWDRLEYRWNRTVISYNQTKQQSLLSGMAKQPLNKAKMSIMLIISLMVMGAVVGLMMYLKHKPKLNQTQRLYADLIKILKPYQLAPHRSETALDFALRAGLRLPQQKETLVAIARSYNYLRYAKLSKPQQYKQSHALKNMIQQFSRTIQSLKL